MILKDTIEMMNSPEYKEQFKAEHLQLKIRIEGLKTILDKYKAGTLDFKPTCSYGLLNAQLSAMRSYALNLEKRAKIEEIDLGITDTVENVKIEVAPNIEEEPKPKKKGKAKVETEEVKDEL